MTLAYILGFDIICALRNPLNLGNGGQRVEWVGHGLLMGVA